TFLRRRALDEVGGLDETLHYLMDFEYWLRLGLHGSMTYLPVPLATLRLHDGAKSVRDVGSFGAELVRIYRALFRRRDVPASVRAVQAEAMRNAYYRAAHGAFWAGDLRGARRYAHAAWRRAPLRLRPVHLLALAGRPGWLLAQRLRRNPYAPRVAR